MVFAGGGRLMLQPEPAPPCRVTAAVAASPRFAGQHRLQSSERIQTGDQLMRS